MSGSGWWEVSVWRWEVGGGWGRVEDAWWVVGGEKWEVAGGGSGGKCVRKGG